MKPQLLFIIGAQRSGTTLLERLLSSHSSIQGGSEPHLLTPLAHLGIWATVDKAPYDHIVATLGQQAFVEQLPNQETDYWQACRAYCDVLYASHMSNSGKQICLDKTPEYATVLPFINKIFPDAKYIVLSRHPVAIFSSFANSFFDNDYTLAHEHEPLLERYLPPIAAFLRQTQIPFLHLHYEDLVNNTETELKRIYHYLEIPFEAETMTYQRHQQKNTKTRQLGDPVGIAQHQQTSPASLSKWVQDLSQDEQKYHFMRAMINRLDPKDLATLGYPINELWQPIHDTPIPSKPKLQFKFNRYRLERKIIVRGRVLVRRFHGLASLLKQIRLICDVLLRR